MHDHPTGSLSDETGQEMQRALLHLLVDPDEQRPWSMAEIIRQFRGGDGHAAVEDALAALDGAGLINRAAEMVSAARPAVHVYRLGLLAV
jgi:hypothetical protein